MCCGALNGLELGEILRDVNGAWNGDGERRSYQDERPEESGRGRLKACATWHRSHMGGIIFGLFSTSFLVVFPFPPFPTEACVAWWIRYVVDVRRNAR